MKREIKFRAWHEADGRMVYPFSKGFNNILSNGDLLNSYENIMQFTGLKDKNGKEIYEGDMVRWEDIQDDGYGCGYLTTIEEPVYFGGGAFYPICTMPEKQFEVIGNIYENPELLKP